MIALLLHRQIDIYPSAFKMQKWYTYGAMKTKRPSNYEYFIKTDTSAYKGEWIAIAKGKVIAHGKDAEKVYKIAVKKAGKDSISLAKTPDEQMLVLTLLQ